jgi:hypothetical protein
MEVPVVVVLLETRLVTHHLVAMLEASEELVDMDVVEAVVEQV